MSSVAIVDPEQLRARAPRRRLTVADYHRMGDAGILHEDDRIELIDGELFQMASIGTPHMAVAIRLMSRFGALAADRFLVSTQNSILDPGPEGYRSSVEVREGAVSPGCLPAIAIRIDDLFHR